MRLYRSLPVLVLLFGLCVSTKWLTGAELSKDLFNLLRPSVTAAPLWPSYDEAYQEAQRQSLKGIIVCRACNPVSMQDRSEEAARKGYAFAVVSEDDVRFSLGTTRYKFAFPGTGRTEAFVERMDDSRFRLAQPVSPPIVICTPSG